MLEFMFYALLFLAYFFPSAIAGFRGSKSETWIVLINLFFGWTGLIWIILLIWSIAGEKKEKEFKPCDYRGKSKGWR